MELCFGEARANPILKVEFLVLPLSRRMSLPLRIALTQQLNTRNTVESLDIILCYVTALPTRDAILENLTVIVQLLTK